MMATHRIRATCLTLPRGYHAEPRFARLQERMAWSRVETAGFLAMMWSATRDTRRSSHSQAELSSLLPIVPPVPVEADALLTALEEAGYVMPPSGACAGWTVVDDVPFLARAAALQDAGRRGRAGHKLVRPAKRKRAAVSAAATPTTAAWAAYADSYRQRYGVAPTRNARVNALMAQFVGRIGAESADVLRFFVAHTDQFYQRRCHDLSCAVHDAESLRTQWLRGKPTTAADVRATAGRDELAAQVERLRQTL